MSTLNAWEIVDANNNAVPPDGWPENTMNYSEVNNTGRAVQGTMKRYFADINGSLAAGGIADAYTLTLNEVGYLAYFAGMYFACEIMATNTGASTIDVNAIGVQQILNRDGSQLAAGTLQSGGIYEFRYDGTDFQLMGTVAGSAVSLSNANLTNNAGIDLVDTDVALNVGAADPDTQFHTEFAGGQIQAKTNATTATTLQINPQGGDVQIGNTLALADLSFVGLFHGDTFLKIETRDEGGTLYGDTDGNPATPDATATFLSLQSRDGQSYGLMGFDTSVDLVLESFAESGHVLLVGTDSGTVTRNLFRGDPDAASELFQVGVSVARTLTAALGGLEANNTLTGAGFERVLTTGDLAGAGFDPSANQTITGDWIFEGRTLFDNSADDLELDVGVSVDIRNFADDSATFIQNLGATLQFGVAGGDFGSQKVDFGFSFAGIIVNRSIFIDDQAAEQADVTGQIQVWAETDTLGERFMATNDEGTQFTLGTNYKTFRGLDGNGFDNAGVGVYVMQADNSRAFVGSPNDEPDLDTDAVLNAGYYRVEAFLMFKTNSGTSDMRVQIESNGIGLGGPVIMSTDENGVAGGEAPLGLFAEPSFFSGIDYNLDAGIGRGIWIHGACYFTSGTVRRINVAWGQDNLDAGNPLTLQRGSWLKVELIKNI